MNRSSFPRLGSARGFAADQRGVSAIEFALLLPVLMLLLAGTFDLCQALTINRKMRQISSTVADLVAQRSTISAADVSTLLAGAATILVPNDTTNLKIVLSIVDVTNGIQTINWSKAYQTTALGAGIVNPNPVPVAIAENGIQMVSVKVDYQFTTIFSSYLQGVLGRIGYSMSDTLYERPRVGDSIILN
ncbi:TadE/TadG family type IV pilus assembly protein [Devosia sp.]|uniref:TadE/TadG family type IV pilus assembly protein n=1 Tax=Devosia sp. TaxID=1871048 RepID=UPI00326305B0